MELPTGHVLPEGTIAMTNISRFLIREAAKKKPVFLGNLSQMWVGGVADSQTRSKHLKTHPNHKNPGVGKQIWERSPKQSFFVCWVLDAGHGYFYTEYL